MMAPLTPRASDARTAIPTAEAARHLGRDAQTLRKWACMQIGPLQPRRVHGRLLWSVAEIRQLLGAGT